MSLSVKERVANGARWLDESFPGWEARIDPGTLELRSGERCICGQVFTGHDVDGFSYFIFNLKSEAIQWLGLEGTGTWRLGFITRDDDPDGTYDALDQAWLDLLKERANA